MPNITGQGGLKFNEDIYFDGAFINNQKTTNKGIDGSGYSYESKKIFALNASLSNQLFGKSSVIQPLALKINPIVRF